MNTVKINKITTRIIAHRGLSGIECENTAAAFVAAGNRSYYGIEADVHETKDKKFVIFHDDSTGRLANRNLVIKLTRFKKLKKLNLTGKDGIPRFDLKICSLEDYISICKKYNKIAVIELKNQMSEKTVLKIAKAFKKAEYLDRTVFISFSFDNLLHLRKKYPHQTAQFLTNKINEEILSDLVKHSIDLDVHYGALTKEVIDKVHGLGIRINCWTVDDKQKAEELCLLGVDYVTTNILE